MKSLAIRLGLETLYFSGAHRVLRQHWGGVGAILALHRVRPKSADPFQPNRHLEITPEFLDDLLTSLRASGVDIVSLDEGHRRLRERDFSRRFVVLTFDDGYRDNLTYAWPILKRHGAPFTVYVVSAYADGDGLLWWVALESAIARAKSLSLVVDGTRRTFDCTTPVARRATWDALHLRFAGETDELRMRAGVREIAAEGGVDPTALCREACMTWEELGALASHELVTIGAHTLRHPILTRLGPGEVRAEVEGGARRVERMLGRRPLHFAYPVGIPSAAGPREFAIAAAAGFRTAVTMRPGVLFPEHAGLVTALPRVSVNGEFQRKRYLDVLLSGAATAVWNGFRRVNAA